MTAWLAGLVLAAHVLVIAFNVGGLVVIPLGAWRGWAFVRVFWWRALHVALLAVVALQAMLGRACFLTLWEDALRGGANTPPLIASWINRLIYWPLPLWAFAVIYVAVLAYTLLLWWWVPPRRVSA